MTIRKCTIDEAEVVMNLIWEAVKEMRSRGLEQWDEIYPNIEVISKDISAGNLFVYDEGSIRGIIVLNEYQDKEYEEVDWIFKDENPLVIHRLCIHPQNQGGGIASKLVRFAEQYAKEKKYLSIRLDSFTKNERACSLYEKMGYTKVGKVTFRKGKFYCLEKVLGNI